MRRARARLSLVPGGVDVERFSPVGPASTRGAPHRIVCLASTTPHLIGVTHVIRALPKLAESELVIGETGPRGTPYQRARQDLQGLAAELGVAHRLHLLGPLDPDQVPRLLRSADVVACTPHSAPEASTALKAMASGVAVVATDVGALADVVIHGVTGLLVSGDNELAAALKLLHAQPFRRQGMGAAGRVRAQSRYSWARVAVDVESVYHNVAYGAVSPDHAAQAAREVAVSRPAHRPPEQREAAVRKLRGMADQGDGDDVDGPT
jgi:glycosyltransferase involved in cell wall biosynthesis